MNDRTLVAFISSHKRALEACKDVLKVWFFFKGLHSCCPQARKSASLEKSKLEAEIEGFLDEVKKIDASKGERRGWVTFSTGKVKFIGWNFMNGYTIVADNPTDDLGEPFF